MNHNNLMGFAVMLVLAVGIFLIIGSILFLNDVDMPRFFWFVYYVITFLVGLLCISQAYVFLRRIR